jgi:hypothetical protein
LDRTKHVDIWRFFRKISKFNRSISWCFENRSIASWLIEVGSTDESIDQIIGCTNNRSIDRIALADFFLFRINLKLWKWQNYHWCIFRSSSDVPSVSDWELKIPPHDESVDYVSKNRLMCCLSKENTYQDMLERRDLAQVVKP